MQNRLLAIRLEHNVKRSHLAQFLGVDYATLYRWEKQAPIPYDQLVKIARFFEVAPVDVVPGLGEVPREECVNA
jgi:DNA-binding XRE family transcriptional regulator